MRSIAIKIGADEEHPGGPGAVKPDGTFQYIPAPEPDQSVTEPTYAELNLSGDRPSDAADTVTEMNPVFPELGHGASYTFGRSASEAAHRIEELQADDVIFFYARLTYEHDRIPLLASIDIDTGYYLIGQFRLATDPVIVDGKWSIPRSIWQAFETNALRRRETFDARVLVRGDPVRSGLYERVLPLDGPNLTPGDCLPKPSASVIADQPWGNRPIQFDDTVTEHLLLVAAGGRPKRTIV